MSSFFKWPVFFAIMLFPAFSITLHNAGNTSLFSLLILSIVALICRYKPMGIGFMQFLKVYWPLHLAMFSLTLAVIINQIVRHTFLIQYYDTVLRLALFIPIFWVILDLSPKYFKHIQWSFMIGVLIAAFKVYGETAGGTLRPKDIGFLALIPFSDMALLFGAIVIVSCGWNTGKQKLIVALKILLACVSLYIPVLSQTRGSWIAIPCFLLVAFLLTRKMQIWYRLVMLISILLVTGVIFSLNAGMQHRVIEAKRDILSYISHENRDTSVGVRLQLWKASWELFKQSPLVGIGRENFSVGLQDLSQRKMITPVAAKLAHSHSEILFNLAILGIFGLLAILSVYMVPMYYFMRDIHHPDKMIQTAVGMGLVVCIGFFVFGLTDMMFFWSVLGGVYSMSIAVFLAYIIKRKNELAMVD